MKLNFRDGKFRVMQVADIQEQPWVSPDSIRLLTLAIKKEKPDLIVFSGDQIYGVMPTYRGNTLKKVQKTIADILAPVEKAGIPFAVTFGNHDAECGITNAQQVEIYRRHNGFVCAAAADDRNDGVEFIPVFNSDKHSFSVVLIDSNGSAPGGGYLPVGKTQLESFRKQRDENGNDTPFIAIQHIPIEEYFKVLKKVHIGTKGAVEAFRTHRNEFYVLPDGIKATGGFMLESPASPDENSGEFDALTENGNCLAISVGHDHNNSFVGEYKGVKLIYTQGCGFNAYGPKKQRGVRIFDISDNAGITLDTHTVTWAELTDGKVTHPLVEFALTHIPTSLEQVKRLAVMAAVGTGAAAVTAAVLYNKKNR